MDLTREFGLRLREGREEILAPFQGAEHSVDGDTKGVALGWYTPALSAPNCEETCRLASFLEAIAQPSFCPMESII
jgi:hypothetical protein